MPKQLECVVTKDGHAKVIAYAMDRDKARRTPTDDDAFTLWPGCPNEDSADCSAVMEAARRLTNPTNANKQSAIATLVEHTGTDKTTATDLVNDIIDAVTAAKQRAANKKNDK